MLYYHLYLPGEPAILLDTILSNGKAIAIGSSADCDLRVNENFVQYRHCYLETIDNKLFLRPEIGRPTLVNGEIVEGEY